MDKQLEKLEDKYGYFHGRFQPFHNGHLKMIKAMLAEHQEIIIGISNPFRAEAVFTAKDSQELKNDINNETRAKENNPWTYWQRVLMIRQSLRDEKIDLGRIIIIPNLIFSGYDVNEVRFPKKSCIVWTMPGQTHNKIILDNYLKESWEVKVVEIKERMASGTEIRKMIRNNEPGWEKMIPKGTAEVIRKYHI